jgi:hypothetical protein
MSSVAKRDLLIVACAVSAGVHAALAPAHFRQSFAEGAGFVAATAVLVLLVAGLAFRPATRAVPVAAAVVLVGLILSYALAATTGLPLLHPEAESVDALAADTKLVELAGLALAVDLGRRRATERLAAHAVALTVMIALFSALATLMLAGGHHHA